MSVEYDPAYWVKVKQNGKSGKNVTEKQWTTIERLGEGKGATIDFQ